MSNNITAIIIAKNEEAMLSACLETLSWCDQIIVVDSGSTDKTAQIAENFNCQVIHYEHPSFAKLREKPVDMVKTDWFLYVDADERVSPSLAEEILLQIKTSPAQALSFRRDNVCYGSHFQYGGWQNDKVTRVFFKKAFQGWIGDIHESPRFLGQSQQLTHTLLHLTHRSTQENLLKSAQWTIKEAQLLAAADKQPVTLTVLFRKTVMELYRRAIKNQAYKDGMAGWIEALVQAMNRLIVYIQVWELQQKPNLPERYKREEERMQQAWKKATFLEKNHS